MNGISCLYAAAILAFLAYLRWGGDRWWPATVLMFGPRWLCVLPLVVLVPAALFLNRKALWLLAITFVFIIGPLMGFCVPWQLPIAFGPSVPRIRVLSCNVHYNQLDAQALSVLVTQVHPDIVALQGWMGKHRPIVFWEEDWNLRRDGELCLGSRYPIRKVDVASDVLFKDGRGAMARYELESPQGIVHFFNLHSASPREALQAVVDRSGEAADIIQANSELRWGQAEIIRSWTREVDGPMLLAGDFNTPPDSVIYRKYWSPFHNAYSDAGFGWGYTYFSRRAAVRIDHQLAGSGWRCRKCWVGPDVGSPHRPVIADWERIDAND
jgi:endonuclease/exonuclease/phosphatase (EEP) superfamily protein YafD